MVTKGSASPEAPSKVFLELIGLKVDGPPAKDASKNIVRTIEQNGILAGGLQVFPLPLQGPVSIPFGEFELLYLDEEMRITRTGQNYFAINFKDNSQSEWF